MAGRVDGGLKFIIDSKLASHMGGQEWSGSHSLSSAQQPLVSPWSRVICIIFSQRERENGNICMHSDHLTCTLAQNSTSYVLIAISKAGPSFSWLLRQQVWGAKQFLKQLSSRGIHLYALSDLFQLTMYLCRKLNSSEDV